MLLSALRFHGRWKAAWNRYFDNGTNRLRAWFFSYFPYGGRDPRPKRKEAIARWIQEREEAAGKGTPPRVHMDWLDLQDYPLPKDDGEKQARGTFHYTCVVYDNYPGERYKIVAFQGCTALMDRSVGRIFFSVAAEAVARGGQSGEGRGGGG